MISALQKVYSRLSHPTLADLGESGVLYGDDLFSYIKVSARDLVCYSLDANIERLKNKRDAIYEGEALCIYVLRKNFWTWAEAETRLTDHEKRYVMSHEISDENGRDVRPRLNDENLLWEICQKMDRCVIVGIVGYGVKEIENAVILHEGHLDLHLAARHGESVFSIALAGKIQVVAVFW